MSIIVSAFPGLGKAYLKKNSDNLKIVDLNSVEYKYSDNIANSIHYRELNPDYPNNFVEKVKELLKDEKPDVVFVPSHSDIRNALTKSNISYFVAYPSLRDRDNFISHYRKRGNSEKFCINMESNWDRFIDAIINETYPIHIKTTIITEEMLQSFLNYDEIIYNSKQVARARELNAYSPNSVNWSIISRERRNWSDVDFAFKDYIDWDMLCKFGKLPESIIANKQFAKYIVWKYLDKNKSKYGLKTRKLISKNI